MLDHLLFAGNGLGKNAGLMELIPCLFFLLFFSLLLSKTVFATEFTQKKVMIKVMTIIITNTTIVDQDDNWNLLLLYKKANHIKRLRPPLNNRLKASRELCLF